MDSLKKIITATLGMLTVLTTLGLGSFASARGWDWDRGGHGFRYTRFDRFDNDFGFRHRFDCGRGWW